MPTAEPTVNNPQSSTSSSAKDVPCRTCTDFKSWAKEQRSMMGSTMMGAGQQMSMSTSSSSLSAKTKASDTVKLK